jgi:hypothetical protein
VTLALVIDGAQVVGIGVLSFLAGWLAADLFLPRGAAHEGGETPRRSESQRWERRPW